MTTKKKPGRPSTLPPGVPHSLRCVVVNGEFDLVRAAMSSAGLTQLELTRDAVLHYAKNVTVGRPLPSDPRFSGMRCCGDINAGVSGADGRDGDVEWVRLNDLYPPDAYLLRVNGRSMEGAGIMAGDLIVVRPAESAEKGQLVIACVDEGLLVKRLNVVSRGDRKGWWLESVGDHGGPPIRLDGATDRRIIGIYCGLIRKS
jgi:hypothetical protein